MEEKKCSICGLSKDIGYIHQVEGKWGYIRPVCDLCYKTRMATIDPITILQAKVEGIVKRLSYVQGMEAESIANSILQRECFKDLE